MPARMSETPWVYIEDIGRHEGEKVTLKGWLYNKRSSGKLHFLQVRDGTGTSSASCSRRTSRPSCSRWPTTSRRSRR